MSSSPASSSTAPLPADQSPPITQSQTQAISATNATGSGSVGSPSGDVDEDVTQSAVGAPTSSYLAADAPASHSTVGASTSSQSAIVAPTSHPATTHQTSASPQTTLDNDNDNDMPDADPAADTVIAEGEGEEGDDKEMDAEGAESQQQQEPETQTQTQIQTQTQTQDQTQQDGAAATAAAQAQTQLTEPRIPVKKDVTLREFLGKMDDYAPIIPDAVTHHYLTLAGLPPPPQTPPHLSRLLALATQKFIADVAADAYQYARIRSGHTTSNTAAANAANTASGGGGGGGGAAGAPAGAAPVVQAAQGKEEKGQKGVQLGVPRTGFGGGGQGGQGQGRTVLSMEDLGMAVGEYGVNVRRGEFYR